MPLSSRIAVILFIMLISPAILFYFSDIATAYQIVMMWITLCIIAIIVIILSEKRKIRRREVERILLFGLRGAGKSTFIMALNCYSEARAYGKILDLPENIENFILDHVGVTGAISEYSRMYNAFVLGNNPEQARFPTPPRTLMPITINARILGKRVRIILPEHSGEVWDALIDLIEGFQKNENVLNAVLSGQSINYMQVITRMKREEIVSEAGKVLEYIINAGPYDGLLLLIDSSDIGNINRISNIMEALLQICTKGNMDYPIKVAVVYTKSLVPNSEFMKNLMNIAEMDSNVKDFLNELAEIIVKIYNSIPGEELAILRANSDKVHQIFSWINGILEHPELLALGNPCSIPGKHNFPCKCFIYDAYAHLYTNSVNKDGVKVFLGILSPIKWLCE